MEKSEVQEGDRIKFEQDKQNPLQKVGSFIKEARLARDLSVEELAEDLRISKDQLTALESGDEKNLPEKVFVKAMVRRISEKLSLDTNFILEELNGREKIIQNLYNPDSKKKKDKVENNITLLCIVLVSGLLGIGASIFVISNIKSNQNSSFEQSKVLNEVNKVKGYFLIK